MNVLHHLLEVFSTTEEVEVCVICGTIILKVQSIPYLSVPRAPSMYADLNEGNASYLFP